MLTGLQRISDFWASDGRGKREPVGDPFRHDHDVRLNAEMLNREEFACSAKTTLDFIGDEQDTVLIEDFFHPSKIACRRNDDAALTHDGLGDERGDVTT